MPKYVCLLSFTAQGIKNLKKTTARAAAFRDQVEKEGKVKILFTLWTIGRYDLVHIFEAPDDDTAATLSFGLSSMGNVRTETMRAFTLDEMECIVPKIRTPFDLSTELQD